MMNGKRQRTFGHSSKSSLRAERIGILNGSAAMVDFIPDETTIM